MARIGRSVVAVLGLLAINASAPGQAHACTPYTIIHQPDGFHLAQGLRWAGAAVVTEEIANPESATLPPLAVILTVKETIAGPDISRLRIEPTDGCHQFWYRRGDHVIAAVGRELDIHPPFDGITNFSVAVWVIRGTRVDARVEVPMIDGRTPTTVAQLRAWLAGLPDTATADDTGHPAPDPAAVLSAILAGLVGASFTWHRMTRREGIRPSSGVVD